MNNLLFLNKKNIKIYTLITIIVFVFLLILIFFLKFEDYHNYYGEVNNDKILVLVLKEDISFITQNILINNEKKNCEIDMISREYILNTDYKMYHEVFYKCDSDYKDKYILDIKISHGTKTLFQKIFRKE